LTPHSNPATDSVYKLVFLDSVFCPLRLKRKLRGFPFFLWLGYRNEVSAYSAGLDDLIGDTLIRKLEVTIWFEVGGVNDRVLDDNLFH
jgi:hypothetical protein